MEYVIYVNGFWSGFSDKKDYCNIDFFNILFKYTNISNFRITENIKEANILLESLFSNSLTGIKKWYKTIHFSGEPFYRKDGKYDIVLWSTPTKNNFVELPLFVYYTYNNNLFNSLINRPVYTTIPKHFCCFIVSNGGCQIRNRMFDLLNSYKKVHSLGKFKNNMGFNLTVNFGSIDFRKFLSQYKFIICFENTKIETYSTEKIINPYVSGTIPIYWSSHHIKNVFNPESMIFLEDETPESYQKVVQKVIELDQDDQKYLEFKNRPPMTPENIEYWNSHYSFEKIGESINLLL